MTVTTSRIMTVNHHWVQNEDSAWWECVKCGERSRYSKVKHRFVYEHREFDETCVVYYDTWEEMEGSK